MKTQKQIKAAKAKREEMKDVVTFIYFFTTIFASTAIWKLCSGNITKGLVGILIASLAIILAEKIRRRTRITFKEIRTSN